MDRDQSAKKEQPQLISSWNDIDDISYRELYRVFQQLNLMKLEVLEDVKEYLHAELNERAEDLPAPVGKFYSIYNKESRRMYIVHITARDDQWSGWAGDKFYIEFNKTHTGETCSMQFCKECTDGIVIKDDTWKVDESTGMFIPKTNAKNYEVKQISEHYFLEVLGHIKTLTTLRDKLG